MECQDLPKTDHTGAQLQSILEPKEIKKILQQPDLGTATGYRDQVIPDVLYSTPIRREEVAKLKKPVSTHTFRHSCATHMLKNGAPIRHIQEMLGHVSLETTQVYTRITINELKKIHSRYHPREQGSKG